MPVSAHIGGLPVEEGLAALPGALAAAGAMLQLAGGSWRRWRPSRRATCPRFRGARAMMIYRHDADGTHPPLDAPGYRSSALRHPKRRLVPLPHGAGEITGPRLGHDRVGPTDHDLTAGHTGEPIGERIVVHGRLLDDGGRPVPESLVEIWQANAAGRYLHGGDRHPAPLDPNFTGWGRAVTDGEGRFEFVTIKPGAYPWGNHANAWRPQHIHFSLLGRAFAQRLVTQMYFPGDPLLALDPIFGAVRDERARSRLVSAFDIERTVPGQALAYRFDIVLRGEAATPFDEEHG